MYAWSMQLEKLGFALKLKLGWRLEKASDKGDVMFKANAGKRSRGGTCVTVCSSDLLLSGSGSRTEQSSTEQEELTGTRATRRVRPG